MRSIELALVTFFVGAAFLAAAYALGIFSAEVCWTGEGEAADYEIVSCAFFAHVRKQVGFGFALNWSIGLCVLLPFFVYCVSETIRQGSAAILEMSRRRMFVCTDWSVPDTETIMGLLRKRQRLLVIIVAGLAGLLATMFIVTDFERVTGQYYVSPALLADARLGDTDFEADWSIAAPICVYTADASAACTALTRKIEMNGVFAGVVYLYLPFVGGIAAVTFMAAFGLFVRFVFAADLRAANIQVVPDLRSTDPRRGFEVLERFFLCSVVACFVVFAMGYLVTLQNVYLRSESPNIFAFVLPLLPSVNPAVLLRELETTIRLIFANGSIIVVTSFGLLFLAVVLLSAAAVLGQAATAARARVLRALAGPQLDPGFEAYLGELTPAVAERRLTASVAWPRGWPLVNVSLVWLVLATISLLFVVIGFYLVVAGLAFAIRHACARKTTT
ncbi:hypothetical protein [Devosia sp.]|uniref:hypothetical protein n=1 Tax=Devosia sp. TaxID=1871048 RepID=UPI003A8FA29C